MKDIFDIRSSIFARPVGRWLLRSAAAAASMVIPSIVRAQGCAMCYTSAAAAKKAGMEALQNGVFILLFPPLLIFAAILWQTFHRRSASDSTEPPAVALPIGPESAES
jgi:hypothetical protein